MEHPGSENVAWSTQKLNNKGDGEFEEGEKKHISEV